MTDSSGFSVQVSVDPASGLKALPDHVASDLFRAYPIPGGKFLLHNPRNGKRAMVMPEVYSALLLCRQFKSLEQHAANVIAANPDIQVQPDEIKKVLKNMLDSGMMVSARQVCENLKQEPEPTSASDEPGLPVVAIITWERPEALERLLSSIASNCNSKNFHSLYVIDDSRTQENITRNQAVVEEMVASVEAPLRYFGRAEQQVLLDELVEQLPEHESAIRFLADHSRWEDLWTAGLSRNLALLLSCGRRLVMVDDDAVCDVYDPPLLKPNISFSDEPRETRFYEYEQDWAHLHQPLNPDPINRHMQCLGMTFSTALSELGKNNLKPMGMSNATALLASELTADSPVLMTECGSVGCPGTRDNTWLPYLTEASLKRMLSSADNTTSALTRRKVWSGRNHPHFAPRSNMSQITGFDNRQMLPPYLPILRGQDRLFGYMLDFVFPGSVVLDYPWAVPHLPLPERGWRDRDLDFTPPDSFPVFFMENILENKANCHSVVPTERLSALAGWLEDMAGASDETLATKYRDDRLHKGAERLDLLTSLLQKAESTPVNWQNYLRNGIRQLNVDLDRASREDLPLKGLPARLEGSELIKFWKDVWIDFAAAMNAWQEIRVAAANIVSSTETGRGPADQGLSG
jgi:hypothetical protein